ncbi:MAG TPA: hypothetical protein DCP32_08965 [Anaerolineaceae bacterium]|nr:hypothetical protein [Anaerolineaceae bacterium]
MTPFIDFEDPPIVLLSPMEDGLIAAYVPDSSQLSLEEARKTAIARDEEAAQNLEASVLEAESNATVNDLIVDLYGFH